MIFKHTIFEKLIVSEEAIPNNCRSKKLKCDINKAIEY